MTTHYDAIIIGAGAAGLMCAIEAGKRGRQVCVIDHANKAGRKILMSGGGRCNFTNISVTPDQFISHNRHFCRSALSRYTPSDFITLVKKHRIPFHEKTHGQLFCDRSSKDICQMLLNECSTVNVQIQLKTKVTTISKSCSGHFTLATNQGQLSCESLVMATGGLSIPSMGSSPFGYQIAGQFDINVWPTRAGLVPFTLHEKDKQYLSDLSGISVDSRIQCNDTHFEESLLFTHRGLSGPAALQISSYWNSGDELSITLQPSLDILKKLIDNKHKHPQWTLKKSLGELLPNKLLHTWLSEDKLKQPLQNFTQALLTHIANQFQSWIIQPNNTEGYRTAEVTLGGVDCNAISSKTFEANNTPGLYFIGEVLDVTGWLGGYNFQWAWASGYAAGQYV
ncbi:MAG: aminoacetone oxidase family FAD-binding enzyme [Coxiellaceae bacterium]|nr:aminoacetone oxidase family FAD-binding enzyme [Coxiellaceae bacterium]